MNSDYLNSIVRLYLSKETEKRKTSLNIRKLDDQVEFNFNMNKANEEKTSFVIPNDECRNSIINFIKLYKEDLMIIDERYDYNNATNTCYYYVLFKNGRNISFNGFSILEMNNIRNILYGININSEEIRVNQINEKKEMAYKPRLILQQTGFTSYAALFLVTMVFLGIFLLTLLVFKAL